MWRIAAALADDFEEHGTAAIEAMREQDPSGYVRVIASLLPKDMNIKHAIIEELEAMSEEEINDRLAALERQIGKPQVH